MAMRPQLELKEFLKKIKESDNLSSVNSSRFAEFAESAEIKIKYEGYIQREKNCCG